MIFFGLLLVVLVNVNYAYHIHIEVQAAAYGQIKISCMFSETTRVVIVYKKIDHEYKSVFKVVNTVDVCEVTTDLPRNAIRCACSDGNLVVCSITHSESSYALDQWKCATIRHNKFAFSDSAIAQKEQSTESTKASTFYLLSTEKTKREPKTKAHDWQMSSKGTELKDLIAPNSTASLTTDQQSETSTTWLTYDRRILTTTSLSYQIASKPTHAIKQDQNVVVSNFFDDRFNQKFVIISAACVVFLLGITLFLWVLRKYRTHSEAVVPSIDDRGTIVQINEIVRSSGESATEQMVDHYEHIPIFEMAPLAESFPLTAEAEIQLDALESVAEQRITNNHYYELVPDTLENDGTDSNDNEEVPEAEIADSVRYESLQETRADEKSHYS